MKLVVALGFFALAVHAQEALPEPSPTPEPVLVNSRLTAKVEEVERTALHVKSEDEGLAYLNLIDNHSYATKSQFIFFRRRGTRLQMIAAGLVEGERVNPKDNQKELIINVDKDSIVKYPLVGDIAVPIADPMASNIGEKHENSNTPTVQDPKETDEKLPGYLQFGIGLMSGKLASDADPQQGGGKNSTPYRFKNMNFTYYSGLFPIGVSYDSHAGDLPTLTHSLAIVKSSESVSHLNFYYRFNPVFSKKLFFSARVFMLSDSLVTDNTGSELFSTEISAMGLGLRAEYQLASPVWKPKNEGSVGFQLQGLYGEFGFSPLVNAKDSPASASMPSRGTTSGGSSMMEYRLGGDLLMWFGFVPIIKRWVLEGSYGARKYSLAFQGSTVSEVGNPITLPQGLSAHESETDYRFFFGFRFADPIEGIFSKGNKGKKEKK
ncbi:MAG: hypothetical protein JST80_06975 [Bdellovibrionales bacterium]|nr:hypothetical protein [Bdellovibrionales bacterium]